MTTSGVGQHWPATPPARRYSGTCRRSTSSEARKLATRQLHLHTQNERHAARIGDFAGERHAYGFRKGQPLLRDGLVLFRPHVA